MIFLLLSCILLIIFNYLLPATFKLAKINLYLFYFDYIFDYNLINKSIKSLNCLIKNTITKSRPTTATNHIIKRNRSSFIFSVFLFNFICLVLFFIFQLAYLKVAQMILLLLLFFVFFQLDH